MSSSSISLQLSLEKLRLPPLDAGDRADALPPDDVRSAEYTCITRSESVLTENAAVLAGLRCILLSAEVPLAAVALVRGGVTLAAPLCGTRDAIGIFIQEARLMVYCSCWKAGRRKREYSRHRSRCCVRMPKLDPRPVSNQGQGRATGDVQMLYGAREVCRVQGRTVPRFVMPEMSYCGRCGRSCCFNGCDLHAASLVMR